MFRNKIQLLSITVLKLSDKTREIRIIRGDSIKRIQCQKNPKKWTKNGRKNNIILEKIKIVQFSIRSINAKTTMDFARHVILSSYFSFLEQRRFHFSRGAKSRTS